MNWLERRLYIIMAQIGYRDAITAATVALVAGSLTALPALDFLRGLSIDVLTALRSQLSRQTVNPSTSPTVIVALDEETFRAPPFASSPNITWTREIGHVLTAIIEGGAEVVGFDIVYPISIEQSEIAFGDETLGAKVRGFDRDYLRALALAARDGKILLGEVQFGDRPIGPSPGQRIAVGQQRNIRALNAYTDSDNVIRRLPLAFVVDGQPVPSMAVELAARALGASAQLGRDGSMTLAGYRILGPTPNTLTLNFERGTHAIPTFSLADLDACLEKGDTDFFRRAFNGKVVIFGTVLDSEDQRITSRRFATAPKVARGPRCALPFTSSIPPFSRSTISGVYIQATAVNNLIERNALVEFGPGAGAAMAVGFSAIITAAVLMLAPLAASAIYAAAALGWTALAMVAFRHALVLPLLGPFLAGVAAAIVTIVYRFLVTDRDRRFLRKSFALYLAPALIEKMVASKKPPELGGETRNVTVYFSDVADFSAFSERMSPMHLVAMMNEYLSVMAEIIEEQGGFIDKYIGDAIVAVFGAPLEDPDHACNAVRAALRCHARLEELNRRAGSLMGHRLAQRIGLNTGEALVGNIGSRRRFNYTVMGDVVNLASRLEGASKFFGTHILASEATVALTGSTFAWREIDAIGVKGRSGSVRVYEPLAESGQETLEQSERATAYAAGLERWRSADFSSAATSFARFADCDPPSARFLERALNFSAHPPGPEWKPVNRLTEK
jgi:class 3 adenylate cyclase/CHASE2 domain-containing sensor protein